MHLVKLEKLCRHALTIFCLFWPLQVIYAADIIGPDDLLRISVYGYDDLKTEVRVSAEGKITFPLAGEIEAASKSVFELEKAIADRLEKNGYIQNAQVNISVLERVSQQISVLGYVNRPGRYSLNSDSTVLDLIAMAGGINDMGDMKAVLSRTINGNRENQQLDLRAYLSKKSDLTNLKMQPGDLLFIPKAPVFYIYGEVQRPGSYRLEPDTTVVKALSIAGGLTLRGTENGIVIKRKDTSGQLHEIDAELSDGLSQEDVVYVKERWF